MLHPVATRAALLDALRSLLPERVATLDFGVVQAVSTNPARVSVAINGRSGTQSCFVDGSYTTPAVGDHVWLVCGGAHYVAAGTVAT